MQYDEDVFLTIDDAAYRAAPGLNQSAMPDLLDCPARFYAKQQGLVPDSEPTDALKFGTLLHTALLEPERFDACHIYTPDVSRVTKAGKQEHAEFQATLTPDRIVVPHKMREQLHGCISAVRAHTEAWQLLHGMEGTQTEQTVFWRERVFGTELKLKARLDAVRPDGLIIDLKTARSASPGGFSRAMATRRYDIQAAHYLEAARKAGVMTNEFIFIVVEKEPPYCVGVYMAGLTVLESGGRGRVAAMQLHAQCSQSGVWPGYTPSIQAIEMPGYMMRE